MNFSLRTLLLAFLVLAIGLSAYVFQLQWGTSLIYTVTVTSLLLAIVAAVFLHGDRRVFWAGFAALGWGYWWFAFDSPRTSVSGTSGQIPIFTSFDLVSVPSVSQTAPSPVYRFITSDVLDFFEQHITPAKRVGSRVMARWGSGYYPSTILSGDETEGYLVQWEDGHAPTSVAANQIQTHPGFSRTAGHSLFCLLFAVAGGALAVWLLRDRPHNSKPPAPIAAPVE